MSVKPDSETVRLFSYGTLQTETAQIATFGRGLSSQPDVLAGYRLKMTQIDDEDFVALSGTAHHRTLQYTGLASDRVEGSVLKMTDSELEQADAYEPSGYRRVLIELASGTSAWVYIKSD